MNAHAPRNGRVTRGSSSRIKLVNDKSRDGNNAEFTFFTTNASTVAARGKLKDFEVRWMDNALSFEAYQTTYLA